jgi:hypothetical protein
MVDPGETITLYLKYKLPFTLKTAAVTDDLASKIKNLFNQNQKDLIVYSLLLQKQPGSIGSEIKSDLVLPDTFNTVWSYPKNLSANASGWSSQDVLKTDKFFAVLVEKQNGIN